MAVRMLLSLALASTSLIFATGCSQNPAKKKSVESTSIEKTAPELVGTHYTTVIFEKGKSSLNQYSKENLKQLADRSYKEGKVIEEIRILAWSDKEYPEKLEGKAKTSDIILASERAQKIKDYFETDLKQEEDIDSYNMARRPNLLSKLLRDDEFSVKNAFEASDATGSRLPSGSVSYTKASKALVIIDYEGDEDNLK